MAQLPNQLVQAPVKGMMDLRFNPSVVSCSVDVTSAGGLVAGQCVKLIDSAGGIPKIVECAANSDDVFGVLTYDIRRSVFAAYDKVEVAVFRNNVIYMEASAAIARGAKVALVVSGSKVVTATGSMTVIGRAYDKAATSGDLIRVVVDLPGLSANDLSFVQALNVAANSFTNVAAAAAGTAGGATPSAAQVDTGIATAVAALVTSTNLALTALQTTLNAEIAALKTANLQASV